MTTPTAPPTGQRPPEQPPAGLTYTSPIPMARTHLGHAIASEWTKIRSVRSTMWTLATMFVLVVGIGFLNAVVMSGQDRPELPMFASGMFGLMLGQICIITLGVLVITSEYNTGMIRTTLTACPQRSRVLLAKSLIFFLLAFVMTTLACTLTALIHAALLDDMRVGSSDMVGSDLENYIEDGKLVADSSQWLDATIGAGLYVALLGLLSLSVGAILRHSAGAITTMVGLVLLPLIMAIFMQGEALRDIQRALIEYSPLNGLATLFRIPFIAEGGDEPSGWPLLGILAAVTAAALTAAFALINKRDV
ncbi:ABC transporter permease [Streptomyces sp. AJS327]|uniref:ABC transporter permease n=1 Tax=Streptomyces sp. AJS327 TaxID=2545265 RepID=UPI0015DFEA76|nr:ABC transporter permease [Streptomyces sp. AJS327]MBA0051613.1 ABC transporter permease [Streptomyces sp. AJS327]